jgi:pimeloyl-ACP methyl ester carboxylesterase
MLRPLALALLLAAPTLAQEPPPRPRTDLSGGELRYELGRRVRAMEAHWDRQPDAAARRAASRSLAQAVRRYFGLRLDLAAKEITAADNALTGTEPDAALRWAQALAVRVRDRLIDATATRLEAAVAPFHDAPEPAPAGARLRLVLTEPGGRVVATAEAPLGTLPASVTLPLADLPEGDLPLVATILAGDRELVRVPIMVSVASRLAGRLDAAAKALDAPRPEGAPAVDPTAEATARGLLSQLRGLAGGAPTETDVPAARRLAALEAIVAARAQGAPAIGPNAAGDQWLALGLPDGRSVPVRVAVPEGLAADAPRPLVLALHGAGGSENLFFDGYGAGAVVREAGRRGWIVAAPRSAGFGAAPTAAIVDELARLYPVDRDRVFLVGHSMGAMQATAAAGAGPSRYAGVAALGGGGTVRKSDELAALPHFVGIGSADFARRGALRLRDDLAAAGVRSITFREYPDIEHLAIVQVALGDVFAFFDAIAGR